MIIKNRKKYNKEYYLKNKDKIKKYYQENKEERIEYQRKWDKLNKDKKIKNDKKRYGTEDYNIKQRERGYSRINFMNYLTSKFGGCQKCGSKNKLEIHHKKYTKNITDCLLLCQSCHKKLHTQLSCTAIKSNGGKNKWHKKH